MKMLVKPNKALSTICGGDVHECAKTGCGSYCGSKCDSKCVVCRPYGGCYHIWED